MLSECREPRFSHTNLRANFEPDGALFNYNDYALRMRDSFTGFFAATRSSCLIDCDEEARGGARRRANGAINSQHHGENCDNIALALPN